MHDMNYALFFFLFCGLNGLNLQQILHPKAVSALLTVAASVAGFLCTQ